jgi:hypothetical protein
MKFPLNNSELILLICHLEKYTERLKDGSEPEVIAAEKEKLINQICEIDKHITPQNKRMTSVIQTLTKL